MSGGHFDYKQHCISDIIEQLEYEIKRNNMKGVNEFGDPISYGLSQQTINFFKTTIKKLKEVYEDVYKIDYLLSGDDSEDTFLHNLFYRKGVILDYYGFRKEIEANQCSINDGYIDVAFYKRRSMKERPNTYVRFYFFGEYENGKPIFIYK